KGARTLDPVPHPYISTGWRPYTKTKILAISERPLWALSGVLVRQLETHWASLKRDRLNQGSGMIIGGDETLDR
ncbi:hypothetical protein PHLCEN_2v7564, partial [Hermanssonia centrifuga]